MKLYYKIIILLLAFISIVSCTRTLPSSSLAYFPSTLTATSLDSKGEKEVSIYFEPLADLRKERTAQIGTGAGLIYMFPKYQEFTLDRNPVYLIQASIERQLKSIGIVRTHSKQDARGIIKAGLKIFESNEKHLAALTNATSDVEIEIEITDKDSSKPLFLITLKANSNSSGVNADDGRYALDALSKALAIAMEQLKREEILPVLVNK
jgi:hypothetical protein